MSSNPSEGNSSSTGSSQADSRQPSGQSLFSWAANRSSSSGPQKIRVTILCARSLVKRDLFRLPDPFVKVHVDGSGQSHVTEAGKNTLDPKWNVHYDLYVGSNDAITISVWNDKKVRIKSFFILKNLMDEFIQFQSQIFLLDQQRKQGNWFPGMCSITQ